MTKESKRLLTEMAASMNVAAATNELPDMVVPDAYRQQITGRPRKPRKVVVNPPRGEREDFCKQTITLSPTLLDLLLHEVRQRKTSRMKDPTISSVVRDALIYYLRDKAAGKSTDVEQEDTDA
jgi:hypothetical protein